MIRVPNNDSHIVDRESLTIYLCKKMIFNQSIVINLNNEGPCAQTLGLYDLLDRLCQEFKYDKSMVTIRTCNLVEEHPEYHIVIEPQLWYLNSARDFARNVQQHKQFNDGFYHFGNFICHGNLHRLHLASYLNYKHADKTLQSYHYRTGDNYHKNFVNLEDMLFLSYDIEEIDRAYEFLKSCPRILENVNSYPILNPATLNLCKVYPNFFVEVVNLTYFSGKTFYIDEKIWRPMIMKTPFLIQGPCDFIKNLKRLGFETFENWWDEGYGEDPEKIQIEGIIANLDSLSKFSIDDLNSIYTDMQPILDHNYHRLLSLTRKDFEIFQ